MEKTRIAVNGAAGRMGRRIIALLKEDERCELVCALEREGSDALSHDAGEAAGAGRTGVKICTELSSNPDVLIDFSTPQSCLDRLNAMSGSGIGAVVGTTGFDASQEQELQRIGGLMPLLVAPNMSMGVNLLFDLVAEVASALGEGYDIEIVEAHHRNKKDAPSGTAVKLAESICRARGWEAEEVLKHGRKGITGSRCSSELGMHALRGGSIIGEHRILYAGEGETLELVHSAVSRDVFAAGAIKAAKFIQNKKPGIYGMRDILDKTM